MALVAMRHNIKMYPTIQHKFLLTLKMGVPILIGTYWMQYIEFGLSFSVIWFADMVAYLWNLSVEPNRIVRLLMVLKKTDKHIVAG